MKTSIAVLRAKTNSLFGCLLLLAASAHPVSAQKPEARILAPISNAVRTTLSGTKPPMAQTASDAGRMAGSTQMDLMTVVFSRSAAQQSALDALIAAQQDPSSPQYHQWLLPDQFAAEFGAADADIATVKGWLQSQGFTVGEVSRSRMEVSFSGTVSQVETAFGTEMHYYKTANGETHFGPNSDVSVPAAMAPALLGIAHLTDQRPHSHMRKLTSRFTSGQTGNTFVQPGDVSVIYDINPAYTAGYTGLGQTIAVVGQSAVVLSDITNFQNASGTPVRSPTVTLIPGTGVSTLYTGDESESDLDLEYSGAIAKGANILFYYTGNSSTVGGAFYALQYVIQNRVAPIISNSYGDCEIDIGLVDYNTMNAYLQQAAAQGQTVVAAAGDQGAEDCYEDTSLTPTANQAAVSVDWPASSQYVTGIGGTEFPAADIVSGGVAGASSSTYWTTNGTTDVTVSAKSYIPEMVWNDDSSTEGLSAGGGGVSIFTPQPTWQTGVPGITAGGFRLVPDVSLAASPNNAGYLYCSSDTGNTGIANSCSSGFRDGVTTSTTYKDLTVAGGTSFGAPIFAGMLAIIYQKTNTSYGGVANPTLYTLASNATTYASAFHDITIGNNGCAANVTYPTNFSSTGAVTRYGPACPSSTAGEYATTTGYDEATGLGSVDFYNLMQAWSQLQTITVTATAATSPAVSGSSDTITVKVVPTTTSAPTPTGTLTVYLDGSSTSAGTLTLSGGAATYTYPSQTTLGVHTLKFVYSGDVNYPPPTTLASGTLSLTVKSPGTFTLSAPALSVTHGSTATETVTLTPSGGYFGLTNFTLSPATIVNACYSVTNPTISGTAAVQVAVTINTNSTNCTSQNLVKTGSGGQASNKTPARPGMPFPAGLALAGLAAVGLFGRRSRSVRGIVLLALLAVAGFGLSGCGSTSTAGEGIPTTAPTGSYTVTVTGTDAASGTITSTTTFTLTIQ